MEQMEMAINELNQARVDPATGRPVTGEFPISRKLVRQIRTGFFACAAGLALFGTLLVWALLTSGEEFPTVTEGVLISIPFVLFTVAPIYMYGFVRRMHRYTVLINDDGIWLAGKPAGHDFVRWDDVRAVRERPLAQRLELVDGNGRTLIKVEYQIEGYAHLREIILECTRPYRVAASVRRSFRCNPLNPMVLLPTAALCAGLAWYRYQHADLRGAAAFGFFAAVIAAILALMPIRLMIYHDRITLDYPLRRRVYPKESIQSISFVEGRGIQLILFGRRQPVPIEEFKVPDIELYEILRDWLAERESP